MLKTLANPQYFAQSRVSQIGHMSHIQSWYRHYCLSVRLHLAPVVRRSHADNSKAGEAMGIERDGPYWKTCGVSWKPTLPIHTVSFSEMNIVHASSLPDTKVI